MAAVSFYIPANCMRIAGIYLLRRAGRIVYVGQSKNIARRIGDHCADAGKLFDEVSFIPCEFPRAMHLERALIEILLPEHNQCRVAKKLKDGIGQPLTTPDQRCSKDISITADEAAFFMQLTKAEFWSIAEAEVFTRVSVRLPGRQRNRSPRFMLTEVFAYLRRSAPAG